MLELATAVNRKMQKNYIDANFFRQYEGVSMNFGAFLRERRGQKKLKSSKEHYEALGGEERLGISLRHFQQIESGKYPPSEKLLLAVFGESEAADRKALVIAYFKSVLETDARAKDLLEYLSNYLLPEINSQKENIWESDRKRMFYSEEQLDFLIENPDAMRFHKRVMLYEGIPIKDAERLAEAKLKRMIDLDLLTLTGDKVLPSRNLYRIPTYENSGPREVAKGSEYILRHVDLFLSREGNDQQVFAQAMQLVTPTVAKRILEQMEAFKRWVQSTAAAGTDESLVPLLFVGFTKLLSPKEL
jgi:transcriptional regulator with XRE-family HTH domain